MAPKFHSGCVDGAKPFEESSAAVLETRILLYFVRELFCGVQ